MGEGEGMDFVMYIIIAAFLFFILQRVLPAKGMNHIAATDLKRELNKKEKQYIDVRTPGEFKRNHISGFKNIPLHQLSRKADKELLKEREVIVICQSGMRSLKAGKELKKLGFTKVTNVKGGMNNWIS